MAERGYSFSLTTFSPSGKLVQIEYALAAVAAGAPSVGIKAANGVVLATEKKQKSILYDERSVHKVEPITKHIGLVYSGMGPDYRYNEDLELEDAIHTAILTLKESFEGQMTEDNIEVGICNEAGFRRLTPTEVKDYLAAIA
ncbi:proteasome subunit alpha type-2 isoform X2 [Willisornis vidua]|nr:proteasome subunit alpha type-2 isoform X2 [Willisornis vidua]